MIFKETKLKGAYVIELNKLKDERGYFARTWCAHEFEEQGLDKRMAQCNVSDSEMKGDDPRHALSKIPPTLRPKWSAAIGALFTM